MLLPGALLVERLGHRKEIAVFTGGVAGRLMMVVVAILPFLLDGPMLVTVAIAASILRGYAGQSWVFRRGCQRPVRLCQSGGRGSGTFLHAILPWRSRRSPQLFCRGDSGTGGATNRLSICHPDSGRYRIPCRPTTFSRISDHRTARRFHSAGQTKRIAGTHPRGSQGAAIQDLRAHPEFMALLIVSAFLDFSLNIAGPFFSGYLVQNLNATASMIGITSIASTVASMLVQRKLGELNDRWGAQITNDQRRDSNRAGAVGVFKSGMAHYPD